MKVLQALKKMDEQIKELKSSIETFRYNLAKVENARARWAEKLQAYKKEPTQ